MKSRRPALALAALILSSAACGGDDTGTPGPDSGPVGACGNTGQGSIAGSVSGRNLQNLQRVLYLPELAGEPALVLSQGRGECNEPPKDLSLVVRLCSAPALGMLDIVTADSFDGACAVGQAGQAVLRRDRQDLDSGAGGSVEIDEVDTCVNGSLSVIFDRNEEFEGNFSAVRCPSTTRS